MNKKINTVLFILAGTIVNLLMALVFIAILLFGLVKLHTVVGQIAVTLIPFAIIGGILLAMIFYQKLSKWVVEHFKLGDKLDPLFTLKHNKKKFD